MSRREIILDEGQSTWAPDAGEIGDADVVCGMCGAVCHVIPNLWSEGGKLGRRAYDEIYCPLRDNQWHKQAEELVSLAHRTPSKTLAKIYRNDAKALIPT